MGSRGRRGYEVKVSCETVEKTAWLGYMSAKSIGKGEDHVRKGIVERACMLGRKREHQPFEHVVGLDIDEFQGRRRKMHRLALCQLRCAHKILQVMDIPWMYMMTRSSRTSSPALSTTLPTVALLCGIYLMLLLPEAVTDAGDVKSAAALYSAAAFLAVRLR